jgi:microtubule-associated protein-like 6
VAFGAHGGASHLEIFEINDKKFVQKSIIVNAGMTSALLSVDWSVESDTLVTVSQAYELKFSSLNGSVSASATRNTKWATWSGKFGFCVQ